MENEISNEYIENAVIELSGFLELRSRLMARKFFP